MKKTNLLKLIILLLIILFICIVILLFSKKNNNITNKETSNADIKQEIGIKNKYECNEFEYVMMSVDNLILLYFNDYKSIALKDPEQGYNLLDKEYREKRFGSIDKYKEYLEKNKEQIQISTLENYLTENEGNTTKYICTDENNNHYIFKENSIMDYTVMLDDYTIDTQSFIDKYTKANEQQKVALNIDKFIQAINNKDYTYAYNCLADSYKNNYFKTELEFENYAKENFYANSTVAYSHFDTQSGVYTYSVILTNKETKEQMNKTFIMQLGEGTEFVMSFNK